MPFKLARHLSLSLACLALASAAPRAQDPPLVAALREELTRSMDGLRMKDQPAPYFIAFRVDDVSTASAIASLGALVQDASVRSRTLLVDVRVGDYGFDNSRFVSGAGSSGASSARLPIDDDMSALRRQVWLTADAAYKRAVNVYSRKKAAFQNRVDTDSVPDFSHEAPIQRVAPPPSGAAATGPWAARVGQLSAAFLSSPEIQSSDVVFSEQRGTRYYVTSEGTTVVQPIQSAMVRVLAEALATDGTVVRDGFLSIAGQPDDLPPAADLASRTEAVRSRLTALRTAPAAETYAGPVLVEGEGAAELLAMTFAPMLTSRRAPDTENPRMAATAQSMSSPYLTRLGSRVLPDGFSVADTPSLARYERAPVAGAYAVDEEGVPARDVTLVENGRLLTMLTSRTPQPNLLQSNGHARGGTTQPGVLTMQSAKAMPLASLRQAYLEMLKQQNKPFGYIVRAVVNPGALQAAAFDSADPVGAGSAGPGGAVSAPQILRAVRVTPDGREEPVRGLQFGPITHTAFRTIAEASTERTLHNTRLGGTAVSLVVPSLIFEDLEIQKNRSVAQKPPIVPTPLKP